MGQPSMTLRRAVFLRTFLIGVGRNMCVIVMMHMGDGCWHRLIVTAQMGTPSDARNNQRA